jgi:uncharacterized protein (DUF1810 family)
VTSGATINDPYDLQRFVDAQAPVFGEVCSELREGRKRGHWMWYIFPQIRGLGSSMRSARFSISSLAEATAYLGHTILGPRLKECSRLVLAIDGLSIEEIFGYPDDLKFHASMTLFAQTSPKDEVFHQALRKYFRGAAHRQTLQILQNG